jgi:hypothetical protein
VINVSRGILYADDSGDFRARAEDWMGKIASGYP